LDAAAAMGCLCARQNPVTKRQTDFDFSNAAPAAWQAWSTSTAEEFGALA
jgi:hypothetical protein